jgi:hypothetical protein
LLDQHLVTDAVDQYRAYRTASYVTIGIGATAVLVGGGYLLFSRKTEAHSASLYLEPARRHRVLTTTSSGHANPEQRYWQIGVTKVWRSRPLVAGGG